MNSIRQIRELNKRELEQNISPSASWHADYRDTAYIYIGGLPFELSEGDILTIFSQYGEPSYINLVRDKESGKSKGFAFLKYEDQRSTDLAVDNLGGAVVMGRTLKVDHTRYKRKEAGEDGEGGDTGLDLSMKPEAEEEESEEEERRPPIKEEIELQKLIREHDEEDPMKEFLVKEKREEVTKALKRVKAAGGEGKEKRKRKHRHRSEREDGDRERRRHRDEGPRRERSRERSPTEHKPRRIEDERKPKSRKREDSRDRDGDHKMEGRSRRRDGSREREDDRSQRRNDDSRDRRHRSRRDS